jgi:hypothetical protein
MARLDSFKNNEVKDIDALNKILTEGNIVRPDNDKVARLIMKDKEKKNDDASLRHQMLRWYNANSDMFSVAVHNAIRILNEAQSSAAKSKKDDAEDWRTFVTNYRNNEASLTMQLENIGVDDITFLEDYLFINYSLFERLASVGRPKEIKPKHLITEDLEKITIFDLNNALVDYSRSKGSLIEPMCYADFLNVVTC